MGVWREVGASKSPATSLRGNMCLLWALVMEEGVEISFGVITSRFGGGRARGCDLISRSLISGVGKEEAHLLGLNWELRV